MSPTYRISKLKSVYRNASNKRPGAYQFLELEDGRLFEIGHLFKGGRLFQKSISQKGNNTF